MNARHSTRLVAWVAVVSPLLSGCVGPLPRLPSVADAPATPQTVRGELSATKAAAACAATGEELERHGYDADAAAEFETARRLDPTLTHLGPRLAVLYARTGAVKEAEAEFRTAMTSKPDDPALLGDAGFFYAERQKWDVAEGLLKRAVAVKPDHSRAWANLGTVYAKSGRVDDSVRAFAHVVTPAEAKYNAAVLLAGRGDSTTARRLLEEAIAEQPGFQQAELFLATLSGLSN